LEGEERAAGKEGAVGKEGEEGGEGYSLCIERRWWVY